MEQIVQTLTSVLMSQTTTVMPMLHATITPEITLAAAMQGTQVMEQIVQTLTSVLMPQTTTVMPMLHATITPEITLAAAMQGTQVMEQIVQTLMSALEIETIVMKMLPVQTQKGHSRVHVTQILLATEHTVILSVT